MDCKHSIAVKVDGEFVHYVGYPEKPTEHDIKSLREELAVEFGLTGFELYTGTQEVTDFVNEVAAEMGDADTLTENSV